MKKFVGNLNSVSPRTLIDPDSKTNQVDRFFLVLGLIYNDLKDLIRLYLLFEDSFPKPPDSFPSIELGEYSGTLIHLQRLMIGLVSEFFIFLKKNETTMSEPRFLLLLKSIDKENKKKWNDLVITGTEKSKENKQEDFLSKIARVRSNVTYHFDESNTELARGFDNMFFSGPKTIANEKAFYSMGKDMESTRLFYCDAAVQGYLNVHLGIDQDDNNHFKKVFEKVRNMNMVIHALIKEYLKSIQKNRK